MDEQFGLLSVSGECEGVLHPVGRLLSGSLPSQGRGKHRENRKKQRKEKQRIKRGERVSDL